MTARLDSKNPFVDNLARLHQIVCLHLQGCSKSCWGTTGRRCVMLGAQDVVVDVGSLIVTVGGGTHYAMCY